MTLLNIEPQTETRKSVPEFVKFTPDRLAKYEKAGYRLVGAHKHSAVEVCRWTKSRLRGERNCYKGVYGVASHRCVQMTPSLDFCSFSCQFCWRSFGADRFKTGTQWDDAKNIVDQMLEAQKKLLSGFGGNPRTTKQLFAEAMEPVHVAISLDGEPTLYPQIPELIKEIRSRGMTAFLVTNGTMPHRLDELLEKEAEPTNLYLSVYATNREDYVNITNSFLPDAWERVNQSLDSLKFFKNCRTIFRMTLVRGVNLKDAEGYSKLIRRGEPKFVELKGYSWLGESQKRLPINAMPSMEELDAFAEDISNLTKYTVKTRDKKSRVIVMVKDEETWKWSLEAIKQQNSNKSVSQL
ncbi:MAG: 4-demethylwyosine synthase TYW1 [Candidatus Bathyarchaeia archaeon]